MMEKSQKISDQKLLELCALYGRRALLWRHKFIGLLPEVQRRELYKRGGCQSIFEFAAKHAGISEEQVRRVLNLEKSFADKPILKSLLVQGSVSINKLARVASIATIENQKELAQKVKILPREALETLVRDERAPSEKTSVHVHRFEVIGEAAEKLARLAKQGHDVGELLLQFLKEREEKIETQKEKLAQETQVTHSRYIPVKVRKALKEEYGKKCSIITCQKPATQIHHAQRFALAQAHNPQYLAPLCKAHHQIAHSIDQKVQKHWG